MTKVTKYHGEERYKIRMEKDENLNLRGEIYIGI